MELKAQPINKVLQYTTTLAQLSGWVRSKVLDGLTRTLVSFCTKICLNNPSCGVYHP